MCDIRLEGDIGIVDMGRCSFGFATPEFIDYHIRNLVAIDNPPRKIIYEEEISFTLSEENTAILVEYAKVLANVEALRLRKEIYGNPADPEYSKRVELLRKFLELAYTQPLSAARLLESYTEPPPSKGIFLQGQQVFLAWVKGIHKRYTATRMYELVNKTGNLRAAFLSMLGLNIVFFIDMLTMELPKTAKPVESAKARYSLPFDIEVQIYEDAEKDMYYYVMRNKTMESLSNEAKALLKELIANEIKESMVGKDLNVLYSLKINQYKQWFMEQSLQRNINLSPRQALIMAREATNWVVGMGGPLEDIFLDRKNVTDIYVDAENAPIYIDHKSFGVVHTLYRYPLELLERAFLNAVFSEKGSRFDEKNPVVDVVVKRLALRAHMQRPPATFGELQGALRLLAEEPFTYAQYLYYRSMTPFFAGFDDVAVTLGASEAVLGVKGVGKTSFTAAKITAIGPNKRIIPVQDIWEIPVRAYRKRGFHIGAAKVAPSEQEIRTGPELDLVTMANALLRMGDAALIINEVRSRVAMQGIINLLNTQPGVFLLYNLHAESLDDIRERLELVFGIPGASMFATDRYTFLKKIKYGRRGRTYRVLGYEFESDRKQRQFKKIFEFSRGYSIEEATVNCLFLDNEESSKMDFSNFSIRNVIDNLKIKFIPPLLERRAEETGIPAEQYILQAFFKGKVFYDIYAAAQKTGIEELLQLDFFLSANTLANRILIKNENREGIVDFIKAEQEWIEKFPPLLNEAVARFKEKQKEIETAITKA
jgi:pilus assembly protein CpaF